jgi:hypothetical protein
LDRKVEFDKRLEELKNKVIELRNLGEKSFKLELEIKKLANNLVTEFSDNKVELGKVAS